MTDDRKKKCMIRIRHLMVEKGIKEKGRPLCGTDFANEIGVSQSMISKAITFERRSPRIRRRIAQSALRGI